MRRLPEMQDAVVAVRVIAAGMTVPPPSGPCSGSTFNVKVLLRSFSAWNLPLTTVTLPACLIRTFQCVCYGNASETAPVDDEPLIDARRPWPLDFLGPDAARLDQPVDVLRAKPLGVIDVELAALLALGFLPVNLLSARLDDVQVKVGIRVPDQGELGVADLDRDSTDELSSLAKAGQAKAIAFTGPRIVVGDPTATLACRPDQGHGGWLQRRRDQLQAGLVGAGSKLSGASGMASGVFIPPVRVSPSGTPLEDPASLLSKWIGRRKGGAKYQRASVRSKRPCRVIDPAQLRRVVGLQSSAQKNAAQSSGSWIKADGA